MKKAFGSILTLVLTLLPGLAIAETLDTPNFKVEITTQCQEGVVGCDKVIYQGTNKRTGKSLKLSGKQIMSLCADGVTPCHSLGYEFRNGRYVYIVSEDGRLSVSEDKKVIVNELGTWK
ncbi:MAG: hypothetical protein KME42_22680 [Tildeniella nuda ZEHNDER 1965/U140]|jgi:hypothetical protein|nr:hypothetical protein [Tildeniella nuda ZEHNDER 1965/U140]